MSKVCVVSMVSSKGSCNKLVDSSIEFDSTKDAVMNFTHLFRSLYLHDDDDCPDFLTLFLSNHRVVTISPVSVTVVLNMGFSDLSLLDK